MSADTNHVQKLLGLKGESCETVQDAWPLRDGRPKQLPWLLWNQAREIVGNVPVTVAQDLGNGQDSH